MLSISYVVGQQVGAHPIAFILYAMFVSAVVLLAITGFGPDALRIMLAPQSWLVGLGIIGIEVFYYILLDHVAPAHGSLLVRLAIPLSMVAGWVLFARRPQRIAVIGAGVVFLGIVPLLFAIDAEHRAAGMAAGIASALFSTLRSFAAEFHPWNRRATTVMEKLRVTGLVVLVTSLSSLALAGVRAALIGSGSAADRHDADPASDAAWADHPPRHGSGQHRAHGDGRAQLLRRRQDHDRELDGGARIHAGRDAAGADGGNRRRPRFQPMPSIRLCCRRWPS